MIKENQKYLNRFHVVLDALVIYCSFCLSYYIRYICPLFKDIFPRFGYWRQLWQYQGILLVLIPVYLILYAKFNLYKPKRFQGKEKEDNRQTCGAAVWRPVVMWRGSNRRLRGDIVRRQYH